jgi:hypothetical protein
MAVGMVYSLEPCLSVEYSKLLCEVVGLVGSGVSFVGGMNEVVVLCDIRAQVMIRILCQEVEQGIGGDPHGRPCLPGFALGSCEYFC